MATNYNHVQLGVVDANGDVNVLYPQSTAKDVSISRTSNSRIPSGVNNLQEFMNTVGEMAFVDKKEMVFLGTSEEDECDMVDSEINDEVVSEDYTWSSYKLEQMFAELNKKIDAL